MKQFLTPLLRQVIIGVALVLPLSSAMCGRQESDMNTSTSIPRPEYPRPQFERSDWLNLNGSWTMEIDHDQSGIKRKLFESKEFGTPITVPFAPESELSGVGHTDFIEAMWYHKVIQAPEKWREKQIWLNFGAVDYEAEVYIDGEAVGIHRGGSCPFALNVTTPLCDGTTHNLVVRVADKLRDNHQPSGKQCQTKASKGCYYTRTTGIWQTVWLEAADATGLHTVQITPDFDRKTFLFTPEFYNTRVGYTWKVTVTDPDSHESQITTGSAVSGATLSVDLNRPKAWSPESPFLYDIKFEVINTEGATVDTVRSYAGLRKIHTQDGKIFINNKPVFLRFVLDQGFYPDGIWTAPSDKALKHDIELSMAAGFNGARLHQKVFEERFHYHADRLGYLTWGEMPSWGTQPTDPEGSRNLLNELRQVIRRDRNHPSIIAWTPWNEHNTDGSLNYRATMQESYELCKTLDPTRPVNETSGWDHVMTDLWTAHNYEQDPSKLDSQIAWDPKRGGPFRTRPRREAAYSGQPWLLDEWGGIRWTPPTRRQWGNNSWGYGDSPKTEEEFYARLEGLTKAINKHPHVAGWCYTQLTDVEQEENGIYNYDRSAKFDMARIRKILTLPAATEKQNSSR